MIARVGLLIGLASPFAWLMWRALGGTLGANPAEEVSLETGEWALRLMLVTLAATPVHRLSGWNGLLIHRRVLGLAAFTYACLHFLAYLWLDQAFDWREVWLDLQQRPFILVGAVAFASLLPLAATSLDVAVRKLGLRAWRRLHGLVYPATLLAMVHFWWKVKADYREPLVYALILLALLLLRRIPRKARRRPAHKRSSAA